MHCNKEGSCLHPERTGEIIYLSSATVEENTELNKKFWQRNVDSPGWSHFFFRKGCVQITHWFRTTLIVTKSLDTKRCRACRFYRCVEGGMNPLCIGSEAPADNPVIQEVLKLRKDLHCSSTPSPISDSSVVVCDYVEINFSIYAFVFLDFSNFFYCMATVHKKWNHPIGFENDKKNYIQALDMSPRSPELLMSRLIDELIFLEFAHEKIS